MWAKRVFSLVCPMARLRAGLLRTACFENCFVDDVARFHGRSMSVQRFPVRARSLPLHGAIFHR